MPKIILVHGCGPAIVGPGNEATILRTINSGLLRATFPSIAVSDFASIRIAGLLAAADSRTGGRYINSGKQVIQQVYNHVTDGALRTRVIETVASAIDLETRVVIAHSLGTVAAYEALCLLPGHAVNWLITLGSPLAIPWYIRDRLSAFSAFGRHSWPRSLNHWTNFFHSRDLVACRPLRSLFGNGCQVDDYPICVGSRNPHRLSAYLSSDEVLRSLGNALLATTRPAGSIRIGGA